MKKLFMRKTAALVASLMIISMLLPIVALAAVGFTEVRYDSATGKVTGKVYVDSATYNTYGFRNADGSVTINVYDNTGKPLPTVYATYATYAANATYGAPAGSYFYDFIAPGYTDSSKFALKLQFTNPVTTATYVTYVTYGQGSTVPPVTVPPVLPITDTITVPANGNVDATALAAALADGKAVIEISGEVANLPASALTKGGVVTIVADGASYELPLDELNLAELAKSLGVELSGLTIKVTIAELSGTAATAASAAVEAVDGEVVAPIVEFKVEAVGGGKTLELNGFSKFVKRTITLNAEATNPNLLVAVRITGNTVTPVPTDIDGKEATLYSRSNSIYTVIATDAKSFTDMAKHWAKDDVEKLAGKLIVNGTGADKFDPKRNVTRAEFAAMLVRSLGLDSAADATYSFSDVSSTSWYAGSVSAAAKAGIIKGDGGKFRPTAVITRQELAAMSVRALAYAGKEVKLTDAQVSEALASFSDAGSLTWAKAEVAAAVSAGIVKGNDQGKVLALSSASRAEAATMVIRYLTNAGFIN
ncbi:MAG TPA: S-layer homology domain-containing protein [Paenibacillus sp.]|uniref:S-layer homology domain-containing protein n=1 Tax=Paenibacillus sp. TaxID=58172 RepID=UPI002CDEF509|nr:S-layer homology domain-containing protein [Paenibacillus sp.]HUC93642.1 S-layer homology domain-containing protein [Paenibacillus sp.]